MNTGEIIKHNNRENALQNMLSFMINKYVSFHRHLNRDKPEQGKGKYFYNSTIMMMDDNEFDRFLSELQSLLVKYSFETAVGRRPRDISILSTPVDENM